MKKTKLERGGRFLLAFIVSAAICAAVTTVYITNRIALEKTQMEQIAMNKANKVNFVLTDLLYKTKILSALVIQNNGQVEDFERTAATILDDPSIRNVLLAPDGVVKYVYPLEENEAVLGLDFFSDQAGNREALQARETGSLVLGGPFELVQGGYALVGRLPIYTGEDNAFWGIASVTLDYPEALEGAELDLLKNQGYAFEIWRINPDDGQRQVISKSDYTYSKTDRFVEYPMVILNAEWHFRLSPIKAWYQLAETWLFIFAGLAASVLIGFLSQHNYELRSMKVELERMSYSDTLTGIMNRRGFFQKLESSLDKKEASFVLCFLDMNHFKSINDRCGHHTGDAVLKMFADTVCHKISKDQHLFARIGGDEFILVFRHTDDRRKADEFLNMIEKSFVQKGMELIDGGIDIGISRGYSVYPDDGATIDELVAVADADMYQNKKQQK